MNTRVSAGVAHVRREAKQRRDKPYNDIKKLIQEARQPNRKSKATAARMLTRMIESNKAIRQMQQTHQQWRARIKRQRKAQLAKKGATETIACIKRWKMKVNIDQRHNAVAAVRKFHPVLVQIEVKQGNTWKLVVAIADTGSGPIIFRMIDVSMAVKEYGMEEPCEGLATPDGNQVEGLRGSTASVMRFKGHTKEHTVTAQVIDRSRMTPILGMDFWKPHTAVFNVKENVITLETEEEDGSITVEHADCWSDERSRKAKAVTALQDQLGDIQKANTMSWAQHETRTVSAVQADDIAQHEEYIHTHVKEAEQLMSQQVNTMCRSTEAVVITAGHKRMRAVTATLDEPASNLHCIMPLEVNGTKQTAQIDASEFDWETRTVIEASPAPEHTPESDSDEEPDLISESETESDEDIEEEDDEEHIQNAQHKARTEPTRAPQQTQTGASAIPPMIVRPRIAQTTSAYVQIAVSNESGTTPLVIRKGESLATLRQIKQADIKHQQTAVIT